MHNHEIMKFQTVKNANKYAHLMGLTASQWELKYTEIPLPHHRMEFYYSWVKKA